MADLVLPLIHSSLLSNDFPSSRSQVCSPVFKRKNVSRVRSKSVPSSPKRGKQKHTAERKPLNIAWTIDTGVYTKAKTASVIRGTDLKVASVALYNNRSLLEAVIIETVLKMQRQNYLSKIFIETSDVQTSLWRKIKCYHTKGYIFGILRIMREWVKNSKSTLWCKEHFVNMPILTIIWDQCKSVYAALCSTNKDKHPNVRKFENLTFDANEQEMETFLQEVLIKNFGQNLCFYRGTKAAGYYCCQKNITFQVDFIPGCSKLENFPEFIIPLLLPKSKIIKCFLPVNKSTAKYVSSCHNLNLATLMEENCLHVTTALELGIEHKRRLLSFFEHNITRTLGPMANEVFFDMNTPSRLNVYAPSSIILDIQDMMRKGSSKIKEDLQREYLHLHKEIKSPPYYKSKIQLLSLKMKPGCYCDSIQCDGQQNVIHVTCEKHADSHVLMKELSDKYEDLSASPTSSGHSVPEFYINCISDEQREHILHYLEGKRCFIQNPTMLHVSKYKIKELHHFFSDCPITGTVTLKTNKQTDESLVEDQIHKVLVECFGKDYKSIVNVFVKPTMKGSEVAQNIDIDFFFVEANTTEDQMKAITSRSVLGQRLVFANKEEINSQLCNLTLTLNSQIYRVVHSNLMRSIQESDAKVISIKENHYGQNEITICIKSANKREALKRAVNLVVSPTPVSTRTLQWTETKRNFILSPEGKIFLTSVMSQTNTYIYIYNTDTIKIHGNCRAKSIADDMIQNVDINGKWISQSTEQNMGHFLTTVAPHVDCRTKTMPDLEGISKVTFNPENGEIIYQLATNAKDVRSTLDVLELDETCPNVKTNDKQCASCWRVISIDVEPVFMLEICKHYYCPSCISEQIKVSIKSKIFPLMCAECNGEFCMADLMNLAKHIDNYIVNRFVESAMQKCVFSNPEKYMFCPNATCMVLLDISKEMNRAEKPTDTTCSYCNIKICIPCKSYMHENITCEENMQDIVTWIKVDPTNRKKCPSCSMGIEKNGGCANVGCTHCKKAICWKCNAFFDTEDLCYRHLRSEHGGY